MLILDKEKCIGCGECEDVCAFGAIVVEDNMAQIDHDTCTMCGACVEACTSGALEIQTHSNHSDKDLSMWKGVWVVAEIRGEDICPVTLELLGCGRALAEKLDVPLSAVLIGHDVKRFTDKLIQYGADRVYVLDHPGLKDFLERPYSTVLTELVKKYKPEIILAGATTQGRSYIPAVATLLETGLTADCTDLDIRTEDRCLLQTRPAFGGNLLATIVCPKHRPQMSTVRPHVMKAMEPDTQRDGEVIEVELNESWLTTSKKIVESIIEEQTGVDLNNTDVIITAGRGIECKENIRLVQELADLLNGAVGATRAVTDAEWISERHQIGQTGKTVSPKLYLGCGVSGAIQHIVGMKGSDIIVAINKDPDAPIFDVSTYGIVGDIKDILPRLIKRIKAEKGMS